MVNIAILPADVTKPEMHFDFDLTCDVTRDPEVNPDRDPDPDPELRYCEPDPPGNVQTAWDRDPKYQIPAHSDEGTDCNRNIYTNSLRAYTSSSA